MSAVEKYKQMANDTTKSSTMQNIGKNAYDEYLNAINRNNSAKTEAYNVNQMANKYMDQTLKAKGLNNTGMSQTAMIANNNSYQKAISQANNSLNNSTASIEDSYNTAINSEVTKQQEIEKSNIDSMLQNAVSSKDYQEILNKYKDVLSQNDNDMAQQYYKNAYSEQQMANELSSAKTNEDYMNIYNKWSGILDSGDERLTALENQLGGKFVSNIGDVAEMSEEDKLALFRKFGEFNDSYDITSGQSRWVNDVLLFGQDGKFQNGDVVDFNVGYGPAANFMYKDGNWIKTNEKAKYNAEKGYNPGIKKLNEELSK